MIRCGRCGGNWLGNSCINCGNDIAFGDSVLIEDAHHPVRRRYHVNNISHDNEFDDEEEDSRRDMRFLVQEDSTVFGVA